MKFLFNKWLGKTSKTLAVGILSYLASPAVNGWLTDLGITIDSSKFQAGFFVVLLAALNYVKHQPWAPKILQTVL